MPSLMVVLKPTASRSVRVLGLSLLGQVYVIRPPPLPKMYVVPAVETQGVNKGGKQLDLFLEKQRQVKRQWVKSNSVMYKHTVTRPEGARRRHQRDTFPDITASIKSQICCKSFTATLPLLQCNCVKFYFRCLMVFSHHHPLGRSQRLPWHHL